MSLIIGQKLEHPLEKYTRINYDNNLFNYNGTWTVGTTSMNTVTPSSFVHFNSPVSGDIIILGITRDANRVENVEVFINEIKHGAFTTRYATEETHVILYQIKDVQKGDLVKLAPTDLASNNLFGFNGVDVTTATTLKHLIKSQNKIQVLVDDVWADTLLSEPLSKADFETHGMDYISDIPFEKWDELDEEFEIITWTDEEGTEQNGQLQGVQDTTWSEEGKLFEVVIGENEKIKTILGLTVE